MSLTVTIPGAVEAAVGSTAPATLVLQLGVPGPAGSPGAQGATGATGAGVAAGGTTGQVLTKIDGTNYNTEWTTPISSTAWGDITGTLSDQTDLQSALDGKLPLAGGTMNSGATIGLSDGSYAASLSPIHLNFNLFTPTIGGYVIQSNHTYSNYASTYTDYIDDGEGNPIASFERSASVGAGQIDIGNNDIVSSLNKTISLNPTSGLTQFNTDGNSNTSVYTSSNIIFSDGGSGHDSELAGWGLGVELSADHEQGTTVEYNGLNVYDSAGHMIVSPTGLTFPDATVQTTAFLGYDSPAFTGVPTAPSAALGDDSTQIATTAFVQDAIVAGSAHAETLIANVRNNTGSSLAAFTVVYISGAVGNKAAVAKAQANSEATSAGTFAVTETAIANNADGNVVSAGVLSGVDTSAYADGDKLYLSPTVAGGVTTTKPSAPNHLVYVGVVTRSHPTLGTVSVRIQNGFELEELHNVAIASVADKDSLFYESSTSLWKNYTPANARTNLGLGTMATATASDYLAKADNLSGLASASTARTNLGLGTASTLASSAVAQTANNLSDLASASTARTNLGLTSLATASFATDSESRNGLLTTKATTPYGVISAMMDPGYRPNLVFATTTSGTGASVSNTASAYVQAIGPNTGVAGYAIAYTNQFLGLSAGYTFTKLDFSKPIRIGGSIDCFSSVYVGDANNEMKIWIGQTNALPPTNYADPTSSAIGWKKTGGASSTFTLMVHNGTTLTTQSSSATLNGSGLVSDWEIRSDGAGNVSLYINGTSVATTSAGPTTTQSNICTLQVAVGQTASAATRILIDAIYTKIWVAPQS